jgi:hypothetical protein
MHQEIKEIDSYEIFSDNFKKKYLINKSEIRTDKSFFDHLDVNTFNNKDLIEPNLFYKYLKRNYKSNLIDPQKPDHLIKFLKNDIKNFYFDHVIKELEFSEKIQKIKIQVNQINQKYNTINIRAGDILYSAPQFLLRFANKAFSAVNAAFLIENKLIDHPVLLGEELNLQNKLSKRFKLKKIINFDINLNFLEKLFLDIFLIAKADIVIANNSRFAIFSSFYGQNKLISFYQFINSSNFLAYENFIFKELEIYHDWYSPEQKAFTFFNLYQHAKRLKIKEYALENYLLEAIKYKNDEVYNILLIDFYITQNDLINANKIFKKFNECLNIKVLRRFHSTDWFYKIFSNETINFIKKNLL